MQAFLQAARTGDWGKAEGYMTSHIRYRIGQEGLNGMELVGRPEAKHLVEFAELRTCSTEMTHITG